MLKRWIKLLKPIARLVLVEDHWCSVGLHARDILNILTDAVEYVSVQDLSENDNLWGKQVTDERYVIIANII